MYRQPGDPGVFGVAVFLPVFFVVFIHPVVLSSGSARAEETAIRKPIDVERLSATVRDRGQSDRARINVAGILVKSGDPKALEPVFEVIRTAAENPMLRAAIVRTLDRAVQKARATRFLAELLNDGQQADEVRAAAAASLGALGAVEDRPALMRYCSDPTPTLRLSACTALLELGGTEMERTELFIKILTDDAQPGHARADAAYQLGRRKDPAGLAPLSTVLAEESAEIPEPKNPGEYFASRAAAKADVPMAAARALGQLGDARAAPSLLARTKTAVGELRMELFKALALLKAREALPAARAAIIDDDDQRVRRWAAVLLKELKNPESLPELRRAVEQDRDPGVRLQAVQALEAMQDREAVTLIQEALPKEELKEVRAAMEQALTSLSAAVAEPGAAADGSASKTN
ncbi:MAG: HEAT repeat domain-containing protein [Gammaproteobacteria bacterium]|nr:HEAT repeat domain-containing protein [Gammaproteobacteria bacterium]